MRLRSKSFIVKSAAVAAAALASACATPEPAPPDGKEAAADPAASIHISAQGRDDWRITYTLAAPATELVFDRSPDASRAEDWSAPDDFGFGLTDAGETLRRTDGAAFETVELRAPPRYRPLPKDYGPFSPFGDGGMLVHSGRFFACGGPCPERPVWDMSISAPDGERVLLDGRMIEGTARWQDRDSGRNVYVGRSEPVEGADFVAILDGALPEDIRSQLAARFPEFMDLFADRLGELDERPMMFVSYDLSHPGGGYGRQGGVLPGQVFMHFYGSVWPEEMKKPGIADDLAWHFAHEAAHIFQHQVFTMDEGGAWIHEGSAEAMAAMALREGGREAYVVQRLDQARSDCTRLLAGRSVQEAVAARDFDAAYSCGMLINLEIDEALRAAGTGDGLYAVWREFVARSADGGAASTASYLETVRRLGGDRLAEHIGRLAETPDPEF